jgi:hypothetical protein
MLLIRVMALIAFLGNALSDQWIIAGIMLALMVFTCFI